MTSGDDGLGTIWRNLPVSEMGLLIDADDYYREFYRAAGHAERYLLLSGWQFDSDVALLRGEEAERATGAVTLLKFLNELCARKPNLQIRILAWDFHMLFALEREWMQKLVFHWTTHENLEFRFDSNHAERGCHHQKFVVADGELSFLGGLDLCDHRWDDRQHRQSNPLRMSRGEPHKPFHDVQAVLKGREVAKALTELFVCRWERAGGNPFVLDESYSHASPLLDSPLTSTLPVITNQVALSRTDPHGSPEGPMLCREIEKLYVSAIEGAQRCIYVETQYYTSHVLADALERRLRDAQKPRLDVVMVLNMEAETMKEQVAVGLAQAELIQRLRNVAVATNQNVGIYYTLPACGDGEEPHRATYIHSKLMVVDDTLLTVGSANLTNRSMAVDTELNATVLAEDDEQGLISSIRKVRATLLAEHTGGPEILSTDELVMHLDQLAVRAAQGQETHACRLRIHPSPTESERAFLAVMDPQRLPFDPDAVEDIGEQSRGIFSIGIGETIRALLPRREHEA